MRSVAEQFDALASERGIRLVIETPEAVAARFDPERMSRVVSNLLANALRFAPTGGVVRCSLAADGETAVIEVADSGSASRPSSARCCSSASAPQTTAAAAPAPASGWRS